jgi:hypothetical protein
MRFTWESSTPLGGCALRAEPDDYDGSPRPAVLQLDIEPRRVTPPRIAAASVLAFRRHLSGPMTFPAPVHPELVSAVEAFVAPTPVYFTSLDFQPKPYPAGTSIFRLGVPSEATGNPGLDGPGDRRTLHLDLSPADVSFSHHFSGEVLTIPSNAHLVAGAGPDPLTPLLPYVAAAVLLADDYEVGEVELPVGTEPSPLTAPTRAVLESVGLRLGYVAAAAGATAG